MMQRRGTDDPSGLGIYPNWAWSWPANRRVLYNRASCDAAGKPWDAERRQVWWNEAQQKLGRQRRAGFQSGLAAQGSHGAVHHESGRRRAPVRAAGGVRRRAVPRALRADREPGGESAASEPIDQPAGQEVHSSAWTSCGTAAEGYNIVCTTYRLTEHYHYWTKNNPMNVQLVPEPFVEIPAELADELGLRGGEKIKVTSARGHYIAKAMVTRRIKPMTIDGKKTYQIGIPIHWGYRGIAEDAGRTALTLVNHAVAGGDRSQRLHAGVQGLPGESGEGIDARQPAQSKPSPAMPAPLPGAGTQRQEQVCKLIDTTTCIGCKACEVACLEWNDLPFRETVFDNTYQTMPETAWNYWNLIKFNEHPRDDGTLQWLMRKDQCMHCADPGCLAACPADDAIVQYQNGIVDFQQEYCIGCQYCVTGCPFNIPKFNPATKKMFKCTLCTDRVSQGLEPACIKACPTGCLHFGTKDDMKELAETRALQLREHTAHSNAGVYDPAGVGGTSVIYVLHDITNPEAYGGLPANPRVPWTVRLWKGPLKWLGNLAMIGGLIGVTLHYLRFGPKKSGRR